MQVDNTALLALTSPASKLTPAQAFGSLNRASVKASTPTTEAPTITDVVNSPPDIDIPEITIDGLRKAWGSDNAKYDLNADGIVNIGDLLQFLAQPVTPDPVDVGPVISQPTPPEILVSSPGTPVIDLDINAPTPPVISDPSVNPPVVTDTPQISAPKTEPAPPAEISVDGFNDVWGSDNADYDLNGDGTVNVNDLLQFLSQSQAGATDNSDNTVVTPADIDAGPKLTTDGFQRAWGTDNASYDLDGNGTVNINDLLQFLGDQANVAGAPPALQQLFTSLQNKANDGTLPPISTNDLITHLTKSGKSTSEAHGRVRRAQNLSAQLIDRFEKAGFSDQPPANVHAIAESLGLDNLSHQMLMQSLQARYPDGLGLSIFG